MKAFLYRLVVVSAILLLFSCFLDAQNCGCDHIVTLDALSFDGSTAGLAPGDTICVEAGLRKQLLFTNLKGTSENPIQIINCGGQVRINTEAHYGIQFDYCEHFRISGTGAPEYKYGFMVDGSNYQGEAGGGMGVKTQWYTQEFEIDHIDIHHIGFAGVMSKTEPLCSNPDLSDFVQYNSSFHDLYIHNVGGEAFYIGYSFPNGREVSCNGTQTLLKPHNIVGLRLYNCIVDSTYLDGIQIGMAVDDVEVYNNLVTNVGLADIQYQRFGIQIGGNTTGKFYNNIVMNGPETAVSCFGGGDNSVFNNVFANTKDGIYLSDQYLLEGKSFYSFCNNTFINTGTTFKAALSKSDSVSFINNFIINSEADPVRLTDDVFASNNLILSNIDDAYFMNAESNDFHLTDQSPAIDAGIDLSDFDILYDLDSVLRPTWYAYDVGAYENASVSGNFPPAINAPEEIDLDIDTHMVVELGCEDPDGDSLIISFENLPAFIAPSAFKDGIISLEMNPKNDDIGAFQFTIIVMDIYHATKRQQCLVRVFDPNNLPPSIAGPDDITMDEGENLAIDYCATDPDGDSVFFYAIDNPSFTTFGKQEGDSINFQLNPGQFDSGLYKIKLIATDRKWGADTLDIHLTVVNNGSPVLNSIENSELAAGTVSVTEIYASDPDGDSISIYCNNLPAFAQIFDQGNGTALLHLQPLSEDEGTYLIKVNAADQLSVNSKMVVVKVIPENAKPQIDDIANQVLITGEAYTLTVAFSDSDGDAITLKAPVMPDFVTIIDTSQGIANMQMTPSSGDGGVHPVVLVVCDEYLLCDTTEFTIDVTDVTWTEISSTDALMLYPNPVEDRLFLKLRSNEPGGLSISIIDTRGSCLLRFEKIISNKDSEICIPVSDLENGLYLMILKSGKGQIIEPFIKK